MVNSFSKYFSMTGWRLGWMLVPADLARAVECLAQNLFISAPTLPQIAAEAVFDCRPELDANGSPSTGAIATCFWPSCPRPASRRFAPPDGAFYLYADIGHLTDDSEGFCRRMLAESGVATTPGVDFDRLHGHDCLRFSYAGSTAEMAEAAERLIAWRQRNG